MSRYRHEYKYRIDARQEQLLLLKAQTLLQRDPHVGPNGTYLIRSAYFDDWNDSCLAENLGGTDPRSKFRIRYYNHDTGRISLEKKSKVRGMTLKESCFITPEECAVFLAGGIPELGPNPGKNRVALFTEVQNRSLRPKVIVTYERIPFVYSGGNVRITFDRAISSSPDLDRFLDGGYAARPVLPLGTSILEVKWDEVLPRHIKEALTLDKLNWTAFSKYFMCRMFHL